MEHIYIYNHRVQDGLVLLFHTQKKEVEGNEAILGPEVISGGVGLEPAFNRKKKIFHVAILRRKYLIMIFHHSCLFLSDCKMCSAMKINMKEFSLLRKQ